MDTNTETSLASDSAPASDHDNLQAVESGRSTDAPDSVISLQLPVTESKSLLWSLDDVQTAHDATGIPRFGLAAAEHIAEILECWRPHNEFLGVLGGHGLHPGLVHWQEGDPTDSNYLYDWRYIPERIHRRRLKASAEEVRRLGRSCRSVHVTTGDSDAGPQGKCTSKRNAGSQTSTSSSTCLKFSVGRDPPPPHLGRTSQAVHMQNFAKVRPGYADWASLLEAFCFLISLVETGIAKIGGDIFAEEADEITEEQKVWAWKLGQSLGLEILRRVAAARSDSLMSAKSENFDAFFSLPALCHVTFSFFFYVVANPLCTKECRRQDVPNVFLLPVRQQENFKKSIPRQGKPIRDEAEIMVAKAPDVRWPCKFYLSQIAVSKEPPYMLIADGPHAFLSLHDYTQPALEDAAAKKSNWRDSEERKKDDQWAACTSVKDAHEHVSDELSRGLQLAIKDERQCAVLSIRNNCGVVPEGSIFLQEGVDLKCIRQMLKENEHLIPQSVSDRSDSDGDAAGSQSLTDHAALPLCFPPTQDPMEYEMQCNFMRHGRAFLDDEQASALLSERLRQEDIDLSLLDREEVEAVLEGSSIPSGGDHSEESDEAQAKRVLQALYEERIRAEWREIEKRWEVEQTAGNTTKKSKNKQKRRKEAQLVEVQRTEQELKKARTLKKFKGFVQDLDQKIFKNRHLAKMLNALNKRGLLDTGSPLYMRGSHLRLKVGDKDISLGTATLVRAHGGDCTTSKFIAQKQLLAGIERAELECRGEKNECRA